MSEYALTRDGIAILQVAGAISKRFDWLSSEARAAFQGRVDHCREALCELIGRQGRMSAKDALATEAAVYSDSDAVEAKLADGIRTFDEVLASLTAQVTQNS